MSLERNVCPSDWVEFKNICYQFNLEDYQKRTWDAAKKTCEVVGHFSSLATITDKEEQDFLTEQVSSLTTTPVWIGLNDIVSENIFKWPNGELLGAFSNWDGQGVVKMNTGWKDCVAMVQPYGLWAIDMCLTRRPFICQRSKGT